MSRKNMPLLIGSHEGRQGRFQIGTLRVRRDGNGLVRPLAGPPDLFVSRDEACKALDGDLVRVEVIPASGRHHRSGPPSGADAFRGRDAARIVEVMERRRQLIVGVLDRRGGQCVVLPRDRRLHEPVIVRGASRCRQGALLKVALGHERGRGNVVEVLEDTSRAVELEAAYAQGFSDVFSNAALKEAQAFPDGISEEERARRADMTDVPLVTIDGADARDFDDAVFAEKLPDGTFRLVVAIADVAHFVPRGSAIDAEALRRGTSVYFPALVLPMLPVRLSNGLCSLNPGEERLSMAVEMGFAPTPDGGVRGTFVRIREAVIRSAARCTYDEVERFVTSGESTFPEPVRGSLEAMKALADALIRSRLSRGSVELSIPETAAVLDAAGRPERIEVRQRLFSHRMIEAFMLSANEAVAHWFEERELPTIYRVHAPPDDRKLSQFLQVARLHGFGLNLEADEGKRRARLTASQLAKVADEMKGHPAERPLSQLLLRAMSQAIYSPDNMGHFGLASDAYLHFTSPIRRYPDLEVHRQLKAALASAEKRGQGHRRSAASSGRLEALLDAIAGRSSERERAAMSAERDVHAWAAASVAARHVGETFMATVMAVTDFGAFVLMDDLNAEGLLLPELMGKSRVELSPEFQRVRLGRSQTLSLGSRVRVRVERVDAFKRNVDLSLA